MTAPWSATTPDGRPRHLPRPPHDPRPDPARPLVEAGRAMSDAEYERAWKNLYRYKIEDLTPGELAAEIERCQHHRALLAGDLAARDFADEPEAAVRGGIAYWDAQLALLQRQARRLLRADSSQVPRRGDEPDFARARYADLVGLAETLTGQAAISTGGGRFRIRCPFHSDDTPSLVIYEPGRGWHCFVCDLGGQDAASFAAKFFSCSQVEGLRWVEQLCDLPESA